MAPHTHKNTKAWLLQSAWIAHDCTNDVVLQMNPQMTPLICTTHPERLGTHQWSSFPESELSLEWTNKGIKTQAQIMLMELHFMCVLLFESPRCFASLHPFQENKHKLVVFIKNTHIHIYNNATYCALQRNIYLSITLPIYLSQYLFIYLSIYLYLYLSISIYIYLYLSISFYLYLSICLV